MLRIHFGKLWFKIQVNRNYFLIRSGNWFMVESDKKCNCTHARYDHIIIQKKMSLLAYLERGIFLTRQLDNGMCKKCTCPKYDPPRLFRSKRNSKYQVRPKDMLKKYKKRCKRCGILLERHSEMSHPFQDNP